MYVLPVTGAERAGREDERKVKTDMTFFIISVFYLSIKIK